jgi:hypothetical protein
VFDDMGIYGPKFSHSRISVNKFCVCYLQKKKIVYVIALK